MAKRRLRKKLFSMTPWDIFIRSLLICAVAAGTLFAVSLKRIERYPLDGSPLAFNAKNAHGYMTTIAKRFPNRLPWMENRRKAGRWIEEKLRSYGYFPQDMIFSEVIGGVRYTDLRNIYAIKHGIKNPEELIVVMAHYDTTDTTVEGAMDDASGVGVVLELARIFAAEDTRRSILFLLTDSEEFGAFWGATQFAKHFQRKDEIVAAASFDFVGPEDQVAIINLCDGLRKGYTPLWLREIALESLRSVGTIEVEDIKNLLEFFSRALHIPAADHGAFLAAGIPAFNWTGKMEDFSRQMAYYHHTPNDRAEIMKVSSFHSYGRAAERFVRTVDSLAKIPEDHRNPHYWKITDISYLPGWAVTLLQILGFIPFILYSVARFGSVLINQKNSEIKEVFWIEAKHILMLVGSMMIGYLIMMLLPALKVIPQYEVYPATQKADLLNNPNIWAILIVAAAVGAVYYIFRRIFYDRRDFESFMEIRQAFHAIFLAILILLGLIGNAYLAFLLLGPPAYFWIFIRTQKNNASNRILNTLLLLGGAITLLIMIVIMSSIFHIGVVYWYIFLSAAYGLFSVYSVVLFFMAIALMIRLFRSFVL